MRAGCQGGISVRLLTGRLSFAIPTADSHCLSKIGCTATFPTTGAFQVVNVHVGMQHVTAGGAVHATQSLHPINMQMCQTGLMLTGVHGTKAFLQHALGIDRTGWRFM